MALSNRTLGILALVAAASAFLVFGPPIGPARQRAILERRLYQAATGERAEVRALTDSVNRLKLRLGVSHLRDEVDSAIGSYAPGHVPEVLVLGGGLAAAKRARAERLLDSLSLRPQPVMPVRVVLVDAQSRKLTRWASFTLLPQHDLHAGCTIVHPVFPGDTASDAERAKGWLTMPWAGTEGPCWFLARFGLPGPAVRAWLDSRYWDVAGAVPPTPWPLLREDEIHGRVDLGRRMTGDMHGAFTGGSVLLQGCAHGRPDLCEATLLGPLRSGMLPPGIASSFSLAHFARPPADGQSGLPPEASWSVLSRMLEDLGPARFAAFWTSRGPVAESFQAASGESLGQWYREQLRRELRQAEVEDAGEGAYWPSTIVFLVLALAMSLLQAERRQLR
jgi:hypothetical protein